MNDHLFTMLFKVQATFLILIKVFLLLKYFMFVKFRTSEWKASHLIYFPANEIIFSKSYSCVKAKKMQNNLSFLIANSILIVAVVRMFMKVLFY
jgi:hypothetical protein